MLFSQRQFAERDRWNAKNSRFQVVPIAFDHDAEVEWTPVWSLTHKVFRYLPTGYLYFRYPHDPEKFFYWADSNGNAAGNTLEEAILQGFLELVERDSVALWWYSRVRRPAVDLASFQDPYIDAIQQRYGEIGRSLWVIDITSDLDIPAFAAVSRRIDKPVEDILLAFGAHLDPRIAIRRAVTELNQFLPAVVGVGRDGGEYAFPDAESQHWWKTATVANKLYLLPHPALRPCRLSDYTPTSSDDLRDDVLECQRIIELHDMEMLVLDQTRPDIGLHVVKVIVPGMRHFWARFAPGRLYDAPVRLGWLSRPLSEDQLNPTPMFL
jgi:thiazole/oxazole-forming peptide maturase SagD family component